MFYLPFKLNSNKYLDDESLPVPYDGLEYIIFYADNLILKSSL